MFLTIFQHCFLSRICTFTPLNVIHKDNPSMKPSGFLLRQKSSLAHDAAAHLPNLIAVVVVVVVFTATPRGKAACEAPQLHSAQRRSSTGRQANVLKSLPEKSNLWQWLVIGCRIPPRGCDSHTSGPIYSANTALVGGSWDGESSQKWRLVGLFSSKQLSALLSLLPFFSFLFSL